MQSLPTGSVLVKVVLTMGMGFDAQCLTCEATEKICLGIGFQHSSLEAALPSVRGKAKRRLETLINEHPHHFLFKSEYEHALFGCNNCNTLHERFYVKVEYGDGEYFETKFKCGICRKRLIKTYQPIDHYTCKKCGNKTLKQGMRFAWD
ncbi:MAG: hypothetical protein HQL69_20720 [Magnetococcales bacterium]|nr:hypothetical protein [Magnetococcales bacterium]